MKKISLLLLLFVFTKTGFAQFRLGAKAGINYTTIQSDYIPYEPSIGVQAGIVSEIPFGKTFFLRPELLYSLKKYTFSNTAFFFPPGYNAFPFKYNLHYINLPVMAGIKPFKQLSLLAGPELGYLVGLSNDGFFPPDYSYLRFSAGICGGACIYIIPALSLEARYTYGLSKINNMDLVGPASNSIFFYGSNSVHPRLGNDGKLQTFQASLNYFFLK